GRGGTGFGRRDKPAAREGAETMSIRAFSGICAGALLAAALAAAPAAAQDYPNKPVHVLVGSSAGGSVDTLARYLSQKLSERWGQQVIVENRVGSGGNLASELMSQAAPDGYTLYGAGQSVAINATLIPADTFDPAKDFVPVTRLANIDAALLVSPAI